MSGSPEEHFKAPVVVEPVKFKAIVVETPGVLQVVNVRPGDVVQSGLLIAELRNLNAELEVTELTSRIPQLESEIDLYQSSPGAE